MAKAPRTRKKKDDAPKPADDLLAALAFVALAQKEIGPIYQTHMIIHNGMALAFDGVVAAAHPIALDISAAPHSLRFVDALKRCGESFSVSFFENFRLGLNAGKFKASIPCAQPNEMTFPTADAPIAPIGQPLLDGFKMVGGLASDTAQTVVTASALIKPNTVVATDRTLMLEYWHGFDMPPGIVVPKAFMNALAKVTLTPVSFGFTAGNSFTVHFDNGAWLKTQMYSEPWPDVGRVLDRPCAPGAIPAGLFEGIEAVSGFIADNNVRLWADRVSSHDDLSEGAVYEVPGVNCEFSADVRRFKMIKDIATSIDLTTNEGIAMFYGERARGALSMKRR